MSVDCSIVYKNDVPSKHIPIAAAGEFIRYWETPATEMGLTLINSFSEYLYIDDKDVLFTAIKEVEKLQEYWRHAKVIPDSQRVEKVRDRIEKLLVALKVAYQEWDNIDNISMG